LEGVINLQITNPGAVYSGTLLKFFTDSKNANGVFLGNLGSIKKITYRITACFLLPLETNTRKKAVVFYTLFFGQSPRLGTAFRARRS